MINVLIACEESQSECSAFLRHGCNAYSCDLQPCSGRYPGRHIVGDVRSMFVPGSIVHTSDGMPLAIPKWHLIIAHPPCTYLTKAASHLLFAGHQLNAERYKLGVDAAQFFFEMLNAPAPYVAVENPVPCKIFGLPRSSFAFDPCDFGAPWRKRTWLWLRNLPPLIASIESAKKKSWVRCTRGGKKRSKSFDCVSESMAAQWVPFILQDMNRNQLLKHGTI